VESKNDGELRCLKFGSWEYVVPALAGSLLSGDSTSPNKTFHIAPFPRLENATPKRGQKRTAMKTMNLEKLRSIPGLRLPKPNPDNQRSSIVNHHSSIDPATTAEPHKTSVNTQKDPRCGLNIVTEQLPQNDDAVSCGFDAVSCESDPVQSELNAFQANSIRTHPNPTRFRPNPK
jgi:hypothetical protein